MGKHMQFIIDMFEEHVGYIMKEDPSLTYDEANAVAWEQGQDGLLKYLDADINEKSELTSRIRHRRNSDPSGKGRYLPAQDPQWSHND